jgi:hypothetical protein
MSLRSKLKSQRTRCRCSILYSVRETDASGSVGRAGPEPYTTAAADAVLYTLTKRVSESAMYTRLPDLLSRGDRAVNRRVGQFCRPESTAIMTASVKQTGSGCKFLRLQMSVDLGGSMTASVCASASVCGG